jgi:hypothetical protein
MKRSASLVGALFLVTAAVCQGQGQPPSPLAPTLPAPPPPSPLAYTQPPPPPPPGPVTEAPVPGAFVPIADASGGFVSVDLAYLKTTIKFGLVSPTPLAPFGQTVRPPGVDLPWEVSPAIEAGYRLPGGDAFVFTYRFLSAEGNGQATDPIGGEAQVRTRLDLQVFDIDYALPVFQVAPRFELSTRLGARIADVFFDSRSINDAGLRQASNDFFGAGIHGRLDARYHIDLLPGLSVFGRLDGAALIGRSKQKFQLQSDFGEFTYVSKTKQQGNRTVPVLNLQAGLTYAPPALPGLSFTSGYEYEQFFNVADVGASSGDFYTHGWFMRVRYDF